MIRLEENRRPQNGFFSIRRSCPDSGFPEILIVRRVGNGTANRVTIGGPRRYGRVNDIIGSEVPDGQEKVITKVQAVLFQEGNSFTESPPRLF